MNIQTLKTELINSINKIDDAEYLEGLNDMIKDKDEIYILSDKQEKLINQSIREFENGNSISNEELEKNDKWLKK